LGVEEGFGALEGSDEVSFDGARKAIPPIVADHL
jgi:hypothetical protein